MRMSFSCVSGIAFARAACIAVVLTTGSLATETITTGMGMQSSPGLSKLVRADIKATTGIIQAGRPIWVEFSLVNLTPEPLTFRVPQAATVTDVGAIQMGLPLGHVFSGTDGSGVTITDAYQQAIDSKIRVNVEQTTPVIQLGPNGSVGVRVELTQYYPSLRRPGTYTLVWKSYQGALTSAPITITVMAERQAIITTDFGQMTMRFYYDQAPNHVKNFIELVEQGFYDNLKFHRVVPGAIVQGGDPRGDGRGIRPNGQRLKAEFSKIPFKAGTVGMARAPRDPDSASCQIFICVNRQPGFEGNQTAFGHLVGDDSFETLRQIALVPTDPQDRPLRPVYIRAISLENVPVRRTTKGAFYSGRQKTPVADDPAVRISVETSDASVESRTQTQAESSSRGPGARAVWKRNPKTRPADRPDG